MNLERIEAENIAGTDQLDALIYLAEYAKVCIPLPAAKPWQSSICSVFSPLANHAMTWCKCDCLNL